MVGRVRRLSIVLVLLALAALPAAAAGQTEQPLAAQLPPALPSPAAAGDWPDPDVTLIDGTYYAVATSGGWAPTFRILTSTDLRTWSIAGSVFRRPPGWTLDSFWAPEMVELPNGRFALYYSAYPDPGFRGMLRRPSKRVQWYCLGVATAPSPLGPWRDLGYPLHCPKRGAIDPSPVIDGDALHLVYKVDGNAFGRPTPIMIQALRADGRRLVGKPRELLRNRRGSWEGKVVEAPELVKRGGAWQMLYSGALCCSRQCAYAVGAARAPSLAGPWTRYSGNPVLRSGNGWRCPGHVSILADHVAFHAYRSGPGILAGRQMHIAPLTFRPDGWPAIGDGRPLPPTPGALTTAFDDAFAGRALAREWEWPAMRPPKVRVANGLWLTAPRSFKKRAISGKAPDTATLARRLGSPRFTATATVDRSALSGDEAAGIAVLRGGPFEVGGRAIGLAVTAERLILWRRGGGRPVARRVDLVAGRFVGLRVVADGRRLRFQVGRGETWVDGPRLGRSPVDETARIALTVGGQRGASGRLTHATLAER